jgi:hypothetical protein
LFLFFFFFCFFVMGAWAGCLIEQVSPKRGIAGPPPGPGPKRKRKKRKKKKKEKKEPTTAGFEPARAEPSNLAGYRLNHSATSSWLGFSHLHYLENVAPFDAM